MLNILFNYLEKIHVTGLHSKTFHIVCNHSIKIFYDSHKTAKFRKKGHNKSGKFGLRGCRKLLLYRMKSKKIFVPGWIFYYISKSAHFTLEIFRKFRKD